MQLSIIIPVYNTWTYLIKNLKSLKPNKTLFDFEVIIIDDKSLKVPKKIIQKLKSIKNIKFIFLPKNYGPGYARNIGLKKSLGKYVWFVDSDDLLNEKWYLTFYNFLKLQKNSDIVVFKSKIYKDLNLFEEDHFHKIIPYKQITIEKAFKKNLSYLNNFNSTIWCYWFKKNIIKRNKIYFNNISHYEDNIFMSKFFFYSNNITKITETCYTHYRRSNSVSSYQNVLKLKKNNVIFEILIALYESFILLKKKDNNEKKIYFKKYLIFKVSRIIYDFASFYLIYNYNNSDVFLKKIEIEWKNTIKKIQKKTNKNNSFIQSVNDFSLFVSNSRNLLFNKYFLNYGQNLKLYRGTFVIHCYSPYSIAWAKILEKKNLKFLGFIDISENGFKDKFMNKYVHKDLDTINNKIDYVFIINRRKKICNQIKESYLSNGFNKKNIFPIHLTEKH